GCDQPVEPGSKLDLAGERRGAALVPERVHRDLPAVAEPTEQVLLRHDDVVQEQLAELRVPGDLGHRPDLDARRAHVDDQYRDVSVLRALGGRVGGPSEYPAPARELAPRDPRLLPADDE